MHRLTRTLFLTGLLSCHAVAQAAGCTISTNPVLFGVYDPFNAGNTDSTGTVSVTCNSLASIAMSYSIKLDGGAGNAVPARRMSAAGSNLFYQLYDSAGRTAVWGDGTGGSGFRTDGYLLGVLPVSKSYTVYGRINARQNVAPGAYADAVTVLLTY